MTGLELACALASATAIGALVPRVPLPARAGGLAGLVAVCGVGGSRERPRFLGLPAAALAAVVIVLIGPVPALVVTVVAALVAVLSRRRLARSAESHAEMLVPELCDQLTRRLRSGEATLAALRATGAALPSPIGQLLREAAATALLGGSVPEVLRRPGPAAAALAPVAACWSACVTAGAPLAPALAGVGEALAAARAHRRSLDSELAGPRLTGWLLAGLPAFGFLVAAGLGSRPLAVLLGTPLGLCCLAGAAALDAAGVVWMRMLSRSAAR